MKLKCLIVDDEPIARQGMEEYVQEISFLQLTGSCDSALKASQLLEQKPVDLMLLDIRMPKLSGIDFLRGLQNPPLVIFTTAYSDFAVESYSLDVIDYLLKPISFERFLKAATKALDYYSLKQKSEFDPQAEYFFIKCDHKFEKINCADVLYVEAMQNYCIIHLQSKKLISYITLTHMQEKLPSNRFMKVHKSFIVAMDKVTGLKGNHLTISTLQVPVSRSLKSEVAKRVLGNNLLSR